MTNAFRADINVGINEDRALLRAELHPEQPIRIEWFMGRKVPEDVIWAATAAIVNSKVITLLQENGFTGWSTYPVEVFDKAGARIEGYSGLAITGRCGPIDQSRSMTILKKFPARVSPMLKGYYFDQDTWDGSDIFTPSARLDGRIFITAPVRDVLRRAKTKNVRMQVLDEIVYDYPIGRAPGSP
jgi:hypothetical protein